jgi:hypothetical protein
LQYLTVGNLGRIEDDLDRLRVTGVAHAHHSVLRGGLVAPGIARQHFLHAADMLEDALHAPEAAAGQHRSLRRSRRFRIVLGRRGNHHRRLGPEQRRLPQHGAPCCESKRRGEPQGPLHFQE